MTPEEIKDLAWQCYLLNDQEADLVEEYIAFFETQAQNKVILLGQTDQNPNQALPKCKRIALECVSLCEDEANLFLLFRESFMQAQASMRAIFDKEREQYKMIAQKDFKVEKVMSVRVSGL